MLIFIISLTNEKALIQRLEKLGQKVLHKQSYEEVCNTYLIEEPQLLIVRKLADIDKKILDFPLPLLILEEGKEQEGLRFYLAPPFTDRELSISLKFLEERNIYKISSCSFNQELQQSHQVLNILFDENTNPGFFATSEVPIDANSDYTGLLEKLRLTKVNKQLLQQYDIDKKSILSKPMSILFEDNHKDIEYALKTLFTHGKTSFISIFKGEQPIIYEINMISLYNYKGCYVVLKDMTIAYQSRVELLKNNSYFKKIIDNSIQGFILFDALDYTIKVYNTLAEDMTNFFLDKGLGGSPSILEYIPQNKQEGFKLAVENLITQKDYFYHEEHYDEVNDYWIDVTLTPIFDKGVLNQISFSVLDITGRKLQEKELRLFKTAIDSSINGFSLINVEGKKDKYTYINQAFTKITQYDLIDVQSRGFKLTSEGINLEKSDTIDHNHGVRKLIKRKDGTTSWTEILKMPLYDEKGKLTHFVNIFNNVSRKVFIDETINKYNNTSATKTGKEFLEDMIQNIVDQTSSKLAYIAIKQKDYFETLVYLVDGKMGTLKYPNDMGICDIILKQGRLYCENGAKQKYPNDDYLVDHNINSFIGIALNNSQGKAIGIFIILNTGTIPFFNITANLMAMLSYRAATEIDRMENLEHLKVQKERFKKLAVNSPDIILIVEKTSNLNQKIIYLNKEVVLGYDRAEIMKKDFFQKIMHPEDLALYRKFKTKIFDDKNQQEEEIEYRLKHKDGHWEWLNIKLSAYDENLDKHPSKALLHLRVITEKKKAEIVLQEQKANLSSMIENTDDVIYVLDHNLTIIACNNVFKESIMKLTKLTLEVGDKLSTGLNDDIWTAIYERGLNGEKFDVELSITDKLTLHAFINPIFNDHNEVEAINVKVGDISEKKKMEEVLVRTNFELDSFVYRSSHDLRAPLRSILGLVEIINLENDPDEKIRFLELIKKSVNKLDTLIADMTDFSRNIRLELELSKIDFYALFEDVHENLQFMDRAENVKISLIDNTKGIDFVSDEKRLKVLFNNIMSNAIKYQDPKEKPNHFLNITINEKEGDICLLFEDNGLGIDQEYIDKIFDMFYRASLESFGSGLGLYIVAQVIEKLEGDIKVTSELGKWTRLECKIPNLKKT